MHRDEALLGILAFGSTTRTRGRCAGHARLQIARGVAQMAAVALTNARLYDELQTASRIRSEFVSTISHELRTPLNVMLGYLEMVRDPDLSREEKRICSIARSRTASSSSRSSSRRSRSAASTPVATRCRWENVHFDVFWRELGRDCTHLRKPESVALEWESDAREA